MIENHERTTRVLPIVGLDVGAISSISLLALVRAGRLLFGFLFLPSTKVFQLNFGCRAEVFQLPHHRQYLFVSCNTDFMRGLLLILQLFIFLTSQGQKDTIQTRLDISEQNLKSIPDKVFDNVHLTYLNVGNKGITFYPPLSALLDSNANQITSLTEKIGNLKNLKTLIANANKLKTLPNSFILLQDLEILDLSLNQEFNVLSEIDKIGKLPKLKVLKIVDLAMTAEKLERIKLALRPDVRVIVTVQDYVKEFD